MFVGIDVHKRTYAIVVSADNIVVKKWQTEASPEALANQLNTLYPESDIHSAYEAGFSGLVLHRTLERRTSIIWWLIRLVSKSLPTIE